MLFLILLYLSILPFQWALSPASGIDLALSRVFALAVVALWLLRSLARRSITLPRPLVLFFFISFLLINTASCIWAENIGWSIRKIIFLWNFLPLFLVFFSIFKETPARADIIRALVGGSAFAALIGILEFFSQFIFGVEAVFSFWTTRVLPFFLGASFGESVANYPSLLVNISGATLMRATAFFPDPHMFSLYLGLSLPFAGVLAIKNISGRPWISKACFLLILAADLLTFSRGGYLGLVAGLLITTLLFFKDRLSQQKISRLLLTGVFAVIFCVALFASPFGSRLLSSFSSEDGSNIERLRLWQETLGYIADRPLLGAGLGNYPLLTKPSADYREPIYAHNLYLDIASETGLLGLFSFLGLSGTALWKALSVWMKRRDPFALAALAALAIFLTHSFFELPLFSVQALPAFLLITALASAL